MDLSSLNFLCYFLPAFLLVYYLCPGQWKNPVLLVGSLLFYALHSLRDLGLLLAAVLVNYCLVLVMDQEGRSARWRRCWFLLVLSCNIGFLCYHKYLAASLPLGISFYTFCLLSYGIDVYRRERKPSRRLLHLGIFAAMFPKLLSGPITAYRELEPQIRRRTITLENIESGLSLLIVGLSFKVILADHLAILWHDIQTVGFESISTPLAWMGIACYSVQLLFDFQGYSLMAIGLGRMLGFDLPENFHHPYGARSISEFYRRWHMSLGQWFRDYLYIPLGGNRQGGLRTAVNLLYVWLVTGIWHGATANYLLWGLALGLLIVWEKFCIGGFLRKHPLFSHLYVLFFIPLSWVIFAIPDLGSMGQYFTRLFPFGQAGSPVFATDWLYYGKTYLWFFLGAFLVSCPLADRLWEKYWNHLVTKLLLLILFWICIYQIVNGMHNPFQYFSF